ncbi:MAG: PEGA domain-containing protein [Myxococcales bacterium]
MADLRTIYRAARYNEPLLEELGPFQNLFFEVCQGPANAPLAWAAVLAAVGALLFVGIVQLSVPSSIKVVADPSGAEVLVDGVRRGQTPLVLKDLPRGRHTVEVRKDGYQTKVLTADIGAFARRHYLANLVVVPPKPAVTEQEARPQSLTEIFMVKGAVKTAPKPAGKKPEAKKPVSSRTDVSGVRVAAR